jgi:multiple sugar transport system permease protein
MKNSRETKAALCFLLPNFIGFLIFTLWPVLASVLLSFTSWDLLTAPRWVGLDNFKELLGFRMDSAGLKANDPHFWKYLGNTFFLMIGLPLNMAGSLVLAVMLNQKIRFVYAYRLIFFFPSILAGVAIFYLWKWIYNPDYGMLNVILAHAGIAGPKWLTDIHWAKPALIFMGLWLHAGGQSMLLFLAALQGISPELYEAAEIDGANGWQRFWAITWPGIMPVTFFIFVMGVIGGLQGGVEAAYIMTGGGPAGATTTIGYYIYTTAYESFQMGYAAAIAWILFLLVLGLTLINWRFGNRTGH